MADGAATITASGGTAPYSYLWDNGKTTTTITGLVPGTYSCKVTDAASSTTTLFVVIAEPDLLVSTTAVTNPACNGDNKGSLTVTATGGTAPYRFGLDGLTYQTLNVFNGLAARVYQTYVQDSKGCIVSNTITISPTNTPAPTANAQTLDNTATIADLQAAGSDLKWYNDITGGIAFDLSTGLQTGKYYVSQTVNGCESTRTTVDVTIDNLYTVIPDINFENKLIALGIDSGVADGKVLTENVSSITSLDVSNSNISNLSGIEDFTALTALYCYSNQLTSLDLSGNTNLIILNCTSNQLSSLTVSKNANLTGVFCGSNQLTSLDISNNINLTDLICFGNRLTSLDVSKNINLKQLSCETNQLSILDVTNNINLTFLSCHDNQLSSIDLSKNLSLTNFVVNSNQITSLDVSKNVNLTNLSCGSNRLTSLDVANNVNLKELVCNSNQLTSLDVSKNAALAYLNCSSNKLSNLNLKNTKNTLLVNPYIFLSGNPNLSCIQVDDESYSNANWTEAKDAAASYSTNCNSAYTLIPDVNFENKLIALGIDSGIADGKVLTVNVSSITSLDVSNSNISNLSGIEDFISLKKLDCGTNKILTLNVSNNKLLTDLNCRYNNLTVLDLSANSKLTSLDCVFNQITALDVSNMPDLQSLLCTSNQIASLDVSNNLALYWFGCNSNKITALDVSKNKLLQFLDCGFNQLTSLDISNNTALSYLNCYNNKLTSLDVSMLTQLTFLGCSNSKLDNLDVSKNVNLNSLLCENINVTTLDVSKNTALKELYCGNGRLTTLDVSQNKDLTILQCFNNQLTDLNIKNGTNTLLTTVNFIQNPDLTCIQVDDITYSNNNWSTAKDITANYSIKCDSPYTLIPDINFENKLIALGIDSGVADGKVLTSHINKLTFLGVSGAKISSLEGIEGFSALTNLECSGNQLTALDLSKNTALTNLNCSSNQLTVIDFSQNKSLGFLNCTNNLITSLDLSNYSQLQTLDCSNNRLTSLSTPASNNLVALTCENNLLTALNINNNTALDLLDFSGNQLTSIDLSQHKALTQLFCGSNRLTKLDLSNNTLLTDLNCSSNQLLSLNLKNGNNTNLHSFNIHLNNNPNLSCIQVDNKAYSDTNWVDFKDATANYTEHCDYYTLIPDTAFEQKLIDLGIDTDGLNGKVITSKISSITSLDVSNSGIKSLSGIEDFVGLNFLYCSSNQLTSLDISKNKDLRSLYCNLNQLTALDLSKNIALWDLNCSSNQFTALDLSKNTAITSLICSSNQLTSLDISNQKKLWYLGCSSNQLTALDISNNTALWSLSCDSNKLTALDIKANTELEALYCFSNQFTSLDVNHLTKLKYFDCSNNQLTSIDVSKNGVLWNFSCSSNQLSYLNIKNGNNSNFNVISFVDNPKLSCILVDDPNFSNNNWAGAKDSKASYSTDCTPYTLISDVNFEQKLIDLGIDTDGLNGKITSKSIESITTLDLSNTNITDLSGIENFTSLISFTSTGNKLTSVDFSKNLMLEYISINGNNIASLDVSKNTKLRVLEVANNQITSIDISQNTNLSELDFRNNKVTQIDLSENKELTVLNAYGNLLTTLDISQNPKLRALNIEFNQLNTLNLQNGNNENFVLEKLTTKNTQNDVYTSFLNNSNLTCIQVDNVSYSDANWANIKDAKAKFNVNCNELILPINNFMIESKGETCLGSNNGEINITATATYAYKASLNGQSYPFVNNNLKITNLTPGIYTMSITIPDEIFEQNFTITIPKGATLTGKSNLESDKVSVEITQGTAPFTIFVDGVEQFVTNDSSFSVETKKGGLLEVKTAKVCEGTYAQDIARLVGAISAHPNPTSGSFEIQVPTVRKTVAISLYTMDGNLISAKTYTVENGKALLSIENHASGVYIAKIELDTPNYLKIIKK